MKTTILENQKVDGYPGPGGGYKWKHLQIVYGVL